MLTVDFEVSGGLRDRDYNDGNENVEEIAK